MSFDHASSIETMSLFETLKERFIMEIMLVFYPYLVEMETLFFQFIRRNDKKWKTIISLLWYWEWTALIR